MRSGAFFCKIAGLIGTTLEGRFLEGAIFSTRKGQTLRCNIIVLAA